MMQKHTAPLLNVGKRICFEVLLGSLRFLCNLYCAYGYRGNHYSKGMKLSKIGSQKAGKIMVDK